MAVIYMIDSISTSTYLHIFYRKCVLYSIILSIIYMYKKAEKIEEDRGKKYPSILWTEYGWRGYFQYEHYIGHRLIFSCFP